MKITWLGHATFTVEFASGHVLLFDPWIEGNPSSPKGYELKRVDGVAVSHGHFDHTSDVPAIAKKFSPKIVAIFELANLFTAKGVENVEGIGKGGTYDFGFATVTAVNAFHSSSYKDGDNMLYAGEPAGYIVRAKGEPTIYFAGDTCIFGDMALIGELYKPEIALLPIGGHFTMGPFEASHAAKMLKVKSVVPLHYATFPALAGTPQELRGLLTKDGIEVVDLKAGEGRGW